MPLQPAWACAAEVVYPQVGIERQPENRAAAQPGDCGRMPETAGGNPGAAGGNPERGGFQAGSGQVAGGHRAGCDQNPRWRSKSDGYVRWQHRPTGVKRRRLGGNAILYYQTGKLAFSFSLDGASLLSRRPYIPVRFATQWRFPVGAEAIQQRGGPDRPAIPRHRGGRRRPSGNQPLPEPVRHFAPLASPTRTSVPTAHGNPRAPTGAAICPKRKLLSPNTHRPGRTASMAARGNPAALQIPPDSPGSARHQLEGS